MKFGAVMVIALAFAGFAAGDEPSAYFSCSGSKSTVEGAQTRIGGAWVTAAHLAGHCDGAVLHEDIDLAVISFGDMPKTAPAEVGQNGYMVGYPNGPAGEADRGVLVLKDQTIKLKDRRGRTVARKGLDIYMARSVREGFSGGPVLSVETGEVIGMILSVGAVREDGFRPVMVLPATTIVAAIQPN